MQLQDIVIKSGAVAIATLVGLHPTPPAPQYFDANHDGIADRIGFSHEHGQTMQVIEYGIYVNGHIRYHNEREGTLLP